MRSCPYLHLMHEGIERHSGHGWNSNQTPCVDSRYLRREMYLPLT